MKRADMSLAAVLTGVLAVAYALLAQPFQTYDGHLHVTMAAAWPPRFNAFHWLYIQLLHWPIALLEPVGLSAQRAGTLFAAWCGAGAVGAFLLLLRRMNIEGGIALIYALLLAWCNPLLENATSVEVYCPALLAMVLALHAWWSKLKRPGARGALALWLACAVTALCHAGFAPWVLALYVSLCFARRDEGRQVLALLAQGAAVAGLLGVVTLWTRLNHKPGDLTLGIFLKLFFHPGEGWAPVWKLAAAPMSEVQAHLGLGLFPGLGGWWLLRRREPALALLIALASGLIYATYVFWVTDVGAFYLPLLPLWGCAAAWGTQAVLREGSRWQRMGLLGLLMLNGLIFLLAWRGHDWAMLSRRELTAWLGGFYLLWGATLICVRGMGVNEIGERRVAQRWVWGFGLLALGMQGVAFTPRAIRQSAFGGLGRELAALQELHRMEDALNVCLVSAEYPGYEPPLIGTQLAKREWLGVCENWLIQKLGQRPELQIWFDAEAMTDAEAMWKRNPPGPPINQFRFAPHRVGPRVFYRAEALAGKRD